MKMILFAWRRLTPPGFIGGAEITEGLWAALLASLGYRVSFIGSAENPRNPEISSRDWLELMLQHENIAASTIGSRVEYIWRGVHCICVPQTEVLATTKIMLTQGAALLWTSQEGCDEVAALAGPVPIVSYAHSVTDVGMLSAAINARFVLVPSRFVQRTILRRAGGDSNLARPIIELVPESLVNTERRDIILFVNPIPEKGVDIALDLAQAITDQEFVFVEGWRKFSSTGRRIPSNVSLLPRQPCLDAQYARTRLVIVPSTISDAAPRVVSEAGQYGIPVVGSRTGGIPELVANPIENCIPTSRRSRWIGRVRQLLDDETIYAEASSSQRHRTEELTCDSRSIIEGIGLLGVVQ